MALWKLCASSTFDILPLSTRTVCQQKSYISKGIEPILENFAQLEDVESGHLRGKFQVRRYLILQWRVGNFAHRQHLKFCHFQPVNCASKNPISPKLFNRISKSSHQLGDVDDGHSSGKFQMRRCFTFAIARWKLAHRQHLKFCHFQHVHCGSKNPISPKVLNRFSKSLHQLEDADGGRLGWKFQLHRYFSFAMARWKLVERQHLKFCHFQHVHCAGKNPIYPKVFNLFSKSLNQLEDVEGGHSGGKFQVRRSFTFAMARWKLCASTTFEILPLSTCVLWQQKSNVIQRYWTDFRESLFQLEDVEGGDLGGKLKLAQVFYFCNGKVRTLRSENIWNFATFNLCTLPAKIQCLQRYWTDFRKLCFSSKMLRVGIWV